MSTTATQTVSSTETASEAAVKAATTNLRQQIVALLAALPDGQWLTIKDIQSKLGKDLTALTEKDAAKFRNVVQSTVSQMKRDNKVEKVRTGNRMPGYTLPKTVTPAV